MILKTRKVNDGRWLVVFTGTVLMGTGWLLALLFSEVNLLQGLALVLAQAMLTFLALSVLLFGQTSPVAGPVVSQMMALHVLVYYGLSNVVPALLPSLRPQITVAMVGYRIPAAPVLSYAQATVAALLFLLGVALGSTIARRLIPIKLNQSLRKGQRYVWLPDYRYSLAATLFIFAIFVYGTVRYGLAFSNTLSGGQIASFSLSEQLLFHGLLPFLPVAPVLAASAYIQATTSKQRSLTRNLLILITLGVLGGMLAWRMRSTAIIAAILPIVLLAYVGAIKQWRVFIAVAVLALFIYGGLTSVRSNLENNSAGDFSLNNLTAALMTVDVAAVSNRTLSDISYRTAGLEGVAAIIDYQNRGLVELQLGSVTTAGFEQAMPAALRSEFQNPKIVKTAPSYLGIFLPGDWVTTFLAELVLDYGALWLFFPAVLAGLLLSALDALLLRMGQNPALSGLLVLRIPFLLYPLTFGGSLAGMTLLFFKATVGYLVMLLAVGFLVRLRMARSSYKMTSREAQVLL